MKLRTRREMCEFWRSRATALPRSTLHESVILSTGSDFRSRQCPRQPQCLGLSRIDGKDRVKPRQDFEDNVLRHRCDSHETLALHAVTKLSPSAVSIADSLLKAFNQSRTGPRTGRRRSSNWRTINEPPSPIATQSHGSYRGIYHAI